MILVLTILRILTILTPDVAVLTLLAGILLVYFEANRPGRVLPGCLGTLLILVSGHSLAQHPVHPAGLALVAGGLGLTLAPIFHPRYRLLAVAGGLLIAFGLFESLPSPARLTPFVAGLFAAVFCSSTVWLGQVALRARRNKRQSAAVRAVPAPRKVD